MDAIKWENYTADPDRTKIDEVNEKNFYYLIHENKVKDTGCVIKLGKLTEVLDVGNKKFQLSFKKKDGEDDTEFDGITLTLTQNSIDDRIKMLSENVKDELIVGRYQSETVEEDGEVIPQTLVEGEGKEAATATQPDGQPAAEEAQNKQAAPGGGGKRSIISPFSRQFELPMHFRTKKRNSRIKKSRDGRRKTRRTKRSRK